MKRDVKIAWFDEAGTEILTYRPDGTFYIPLGMSTTDRKQLAELGKAIADALSDDFAREVKVARDKAGVE